MTAKPQSLTTDLPELRPALQTAGREAGVSTFSIRPKLDRADRLTLSVTEAAEVIGISRALAYELVARGELPSVRLGHRLVVPKAALLAMFGVNADAGIA
jgi:excisionase family DNA binding protein